MSLKQIRYFLVIAEEGHFGRAAARLRIAQPALSRQIALLEAELGCAVFERHPRGVRLTAAGAAYRDEVVKVQALLDRAQTAARAAAAGVEGSLRLGLIEVAGWAGIVPQAIRAARDHLPGVRLELQTLSSTGQVAALQEGRLDAGFLYNPPQDAGLAVLPVAMHRMLLAVPRGHPLGRGPVALADLAGETLIGFPRAASAALHDALTAALEKAGLQGFSTMVETEANILSLVNAGAGVALVNENQRHRPPPGVDFVPVRDLQVGLSLALAWPASASLAARDRLVGLVRGLLATAPGNSVAPCVSEDQEQAAQDSCLGPLRVTNPFGLPGLYWRDGSFTVADVLRLRHLGDPAGPVEIDIPADLARAVPKRRAEFLAGRACAALALRAAGLPEAVGRKGRAPVWPEVAGSISHGGGRVAAVVAPELAGIGVDLEPLMPDERAADLHPALISEAEAALAGNLPFATYVTLAFSAKEALYKALAHRLVRVPGFLEAEVIAIGPDCLTLRFDGDRHLVRWRIEDGYALTLACDPTSNP